MRLELREGQRVCRVEWKTGQPFLRVGIVTKVTKSTYYIDNERGTDWFTNGKSAIAKEYLELFEMWGLMYGRRPEGWTLQDTVRCVCRVRRLERRLIRSK
jgi:hypothetical protein